MDLLALRPWLIVGGVVALVVLIHYAIYRMLQGDKSIVREFSVWGKAAQGGRIAQQKQSADLDELHKRVAELPRQTE